MKKNILFIGNFVNDVILIHTDLKLGRERSFTDFMSPDNQKELAKQPTQKVIKADALGGSVTYGSLAAHYFGDTNSFIVTKMGNDINQEFESLIKSKLINKEGDEGSIDLSYSNIDDKSNTKNTSYYLNYYNNKKNRTLSLMEKGFNIEAKNCIKCIEGVRPNALLFVPVSGEFDESLVTETLDHIKKMNKKTNKPFVDHNEQEQNLPYNPVIAFDVQGFLRCFNGSRVTTRPMHIMIQKLVNIKISLNDMDDIVTVVKAEYGEAAAIMGEHDPATCAKLLRQNFGFTIVAVTMGGDGLFLSSSITGEIYIPTFKPEKVSDETGCGDTFLTCTVLEILNLLNDPSHQLFNNVNSSNTIHNQNNYEKDILLKRNIKREELIHCLQVGSSGASFLVEQMGPKGFANRDTIIDRVKNGKQQIKQQYLQFNNPIIAKFEPEQARNVPSLNSNTEKQKVFKSTTHYK
ncbi:hypothetical protein DICPUDRAFT_98455 [Dictyostelium purpureum]|uniref:Carbohydrate kinase PfkB domain-containing protein n=1 Tax=Dictyostelium purpureum TaxID=5786 RepID=F0ZQG5_DICPU|nr:uncharacterized protein DICPUDRAFT_98455 [Dictyostelium purpureum]EGC33833.1 hypothetical protein DICPUDRAFT_98455 [Dictyostelium purpureum]|eukprot:XP_003289659.1 hypothetical protein DICPUDRAFT_98455 [Dictyostelium purpureum]